MKRFVSLLVSAAILAVLWWQVDTNAILAAARAADPWWLAAGLAAVIPLTIGTALRFRWLSQAPIGHGTALRLILAASTLNLFLPSKMGDLAKGWVLERKHAMPRGQAVALVVFEKLMDLASLLFWGIFAFIVWQPDDPAFLLGALAVAGGFTALGVVMTPLISRVPLPPRVSVFGDNWQAMVAGFWRRPMHAMRVIAASLALWAGHLAQFWLFAQAIGAVPFLRNMAAATLSILAGLLPFTVAGVGTRDAAIVYFYQQWLTPGQCAMLGLLATLRYVMPAIAGLPFMSDYWQRGEKVPAS